MNLIKEKPSYHAPKVKRTRKRAFLTMEDCKKMLEYAYGHPKDFAPEITNLIHFLVLTGCRLGELRALSPEDIDLKNNLISINKRIYKGVIDTPKNNKSGHIPLHPDLVAVYERQLERNKFTRMKKHTDEKGILFLSNWTGKRLSHTIIHYKIKELAQAVLGYADGVSAHAFRRSLSNHLIGEGLDINSVSRMLRNTNQVMLNAYTQQNLDKLKGEFNSLPITGSVNTKVDD